MSIADVKKTAEHKMQRSLEALKADLAKVRTGRAHTGLLDHVQVEYPKAGIVAVLGSKVAGVPIRIHTVAGLPLMETKGIKRKVLNFVEKITYACANKVYPNSTGLYDFILKNKLTHTQKLKVIANGSSNGINTEYFSPNSIDIEKTTALKQTLNITNQDFVFVFVGRFS